MKSKKIRVGVVGCGAIGSRIVESIHTDLKKYCQLTGIYDTDKKKTDRLNKKLRLRGKVKDSIPALIKDCDCMVEAVSSENTHHIIKSALNARKSVLAMSVGKLLNADDLFRLAKRKKTALLLPSGAVAGIDAIKAASLASIKKVTLTTRKPPAGLKGNPFLESMGIDLDKIKKETVIFKGTVDQAVKNFPQNINVAATIALACQAKDKMTIQIISSPKFKTNSHEIEVIGDFGTMVTRTDNRPCPDNPKTSYLAVLSGVQTLKQYCIGILIGT